MPGGNGTNLSPISLYVAYEDALGEPFRAEDLPLLTAALPRETAASYLSALGGTLDSPHWGARQADLVDRFLVPRSVADRVKRLLTSGERQCWAHAPMVVAGWRALALWGDANSQRTDDFPRLFTKWLFLLCDAFGEAQARALEHAGGPSSDSLLTDIAFTLQSNWVQERADVFYALSRAYSLLFEMPSLLKPGDRKPREQVDTVAPLVLGGSLLQCVAVGVALWARWLRLSDPTRMEQPPLDVAVVDPGAYFKQLGVAVSALGQVLGKVTQTFHDLRSACSADDRDKPWHPRDLLPIRRHPLIAFGPPNMVAYTLPRHIVEAFTTGLYHRLSDHFSQAENRPDSTFRSYWGKLVEVYTGTLLRKTFPLGSPLKRPVFLPGDPGVTGPARFDGIVMYPFRGQTAIVFESVSKPFTVDALTGLDLKALDQDLKLIVLDKIRQLGRACSDLHTGTTRLVYGGKSLVPTHFTPVLVTWQGTPVWGPVMRLVDQLCKDDDLFAGLSHDPIQILSIEEFERLLELVWCNNRSLLYVLRRRAADPQARDESMEISLYNQGLQRRADKRHPLLGGSFQDLHEAVIRLLKGETGPFGEPAA